MRYPSIARPAQSSSSAGSGARLRLVPALGVLALVLAGHALLLGDLPTRQTPVRQPQLAPPAAGVLQTRQILELPAAMTITKSELPPESSATAPPDAPAWPARLITTRRAEPAAREVAAEPASATEPLLRLVAANQADNLAATQATALSANATNAAVAGPGHEGAEDLDVPVYATRLPPAARLQYELRRGALRGSGQLVWLPGEAAYNLSLEASAFGASLIGQSSNGGFDAAGIAPLRFLDRRRGRDAQAANFQRDRALITFSGPDVQVALLLGTQDRLSWMLQLSAIVEAAPKRFMPGTQITLFVVGARGEASVWTFDIEAREVIDLPAGPVPGALRLKREPRKPYDTQAEVWLDPARHHLPVKVRQVASQGGDATELLLRSSGPP